MTEFPETIGMSLDERADWIAEAAAAWVRDKAYKRGGSEYHAREVFNNVRSRAHKALREQKEACGGPTGDDDALAEEIARVIAPLAWLVKGSAQDDRLTELQREMALNKAREAIRIVREHDEVHLPHLGMVS